MNSLRQKLNSHGLEIPSILLPKIAQTASALELSRWPVIACDQFTQDRDYWERAKIAAAGSPSTLNLIFPEVFLSDNDAPQRITDIHSTMNRYLQENVFGEGQYGFIYIERDTPYQKKRRGLVAAIDLEQYDWHPDARPLIRSTEGTVAERLPARMDIRRGAPLELPHVLLLIDDDTDSLLPALAGRVKNNVPVYTTPLMMDSGNVSGWLVNTDSDLNFIAEKIEELLCRSVERYNGNKPFLFAVGDGNHSLAAAKGIWTELKEQGAKFAHPCRYALVEIENIYDPAIQFEPIHRLVFNIGFDETLSLLSQLADFSFRNINSAKELSSAVGSLHGIADTPAGFSGNRFGIVSRGRYALVETSAGGIATACLQPLLDLYAKDNPHLIDYIHDDEEIFRLADSGAVSGNVTGILLPPVQKSGLFETVGRLGPLPRKSFSMGHSCEKRFYLECRALF